MDIGIPREVSNSERRVAVSPAGVRRLVAAGNRVYVERSAGLSSRFGDEEYLAAGAQLAYDAEEVYGRGDLVVKIAPPAPLEFDFLREGQILFSFLMPMLMSPDRFRILLDRKVTAIGMELVEDAKGDLPILQAMSEIAGPLSIHVAAHLLESAPGGRGILLGGATGIPPATVVILGAGVVGTTAARTALGNGAQVMVLDRDLDRLRRIDELFFRRCTTLVADDYLLERSIQFADVLVGAVLIRGERTPHVVTERMVRSMKPGSVILDVSIDQGGCVETSRPTTLQEPTFVYENVVHFAVPNMPSCVARTATYALTNAAIKYYLELGESSLAEAAEANPGLGRGVITAGGFCLSPVVADLFRVPVGDPQDILPAMREAHANS